VTRSSNSGQTRRGFFTRAGLGLAAATAAVTLEPGIAAAEPPTDEELHKAALAEYRPLGKTGKMVSKIGFGSASLTAPGVLDRAIDLGINYIDTAACYNGGKSEETLGKILKKRRADVVLTTKWHPRADSKRKEMLTSLDDSLKRLKCDHVDCVLVHSVGEVDRIRNEEVFEAFAAAKKAGKVSHLGMSSHSPELIDVVKDAVALKHYEIVLLKYSFMAYPKLDPLLDDLHKAGIAVTVMKTRDGAKHVDLEKFNKGDGGFMGAALRWASSNPKIASTVISINTFEDLAIAAQAAGQKLAMGDVDLLHQYAATFDKEQCRWCGECGPSCPSGVKVWEVDRAAMYFQNYREERRGMELYAELGQPAAGCAACAAPCESSCRFEIPIKTQLTRAHDLLSWNPRHTLG